MKKIEEIIQNMVECYILEEWFVCEKCDLPKPRHNRWIGMPDDDGCPMEDDDLCPKNILWDNSEKVAEAILNLDCVKQNKILLSALNDEISGTRVYRDDMPDHYFTILPVNGMSYIYIDDPKEGEKPIHSEPTHELASEWCGRNIDMLVNIGTRWPKNRSWE
jgi:hypothetical protein